MTESIYEFGAMSGVFTLVASDPRVAVVAMQNQYDSFPMVACYSHPEHAPCNYFSPLHGTKEEREARCAEFFGAAGVEDFLDENLPAIQAAVDSIQGGKIADRKPATSASTGDRADG